MFDKKKVKKEIKVPKPKATKYPVVLDEIAFDKKIGVTHADNEENINHLAGEKSMLEKVKQALTK